ncbi:MAG: LysR family transcriptional regulator, partial [Gammaproteobacteria bacterium]
KLSVVGEKLLNANSQLLSRFSPELDNFSTQFSRDFSALLTQSNSSSLKLYASHGLAISQLRSQLNQHSSVNLDLHFYGSLESLRALNSSQCDIAGFHIPIGPMAHSLAPHYLAQLNAQQHTLIYVVKRNQGLMVKAGNPKGIDSIRSLAHISCEFINRQVGSGTRLLFDQLLQNNNIEPADIEGYQNEEFTHMAVAAMIASGVADVGFGIAPMAEKFELEFIPLIWEHYCLAIPTEIIADERVEHIISLLKNTAFKHELSAYAGYDASHSGDAVSFETIFT